VAIETASQEQALHEASARCGLHEEIVAVRITASSEYVHGRPRIDRIIVHYHGAPNTAMAALLLGAVDMTPVGSSYNLEQLLVVKNAWDPVQSARLLNEAGRTRGADGVYQKNGQRFQLDAAALARSNAQEASALAVQWSQLGFQSSPSLIPANATNSQELTSTFQGAITWPGAFRDAAVRDWTSEQIGTPETRWRGSNVGAYRNAQMDQLYERFQVALRASEQEQILTDALMLAYEDLPFIPSYVYMIPLLFRTGVVGPDRVSPNQLASAWNVHTWDVN
jgi:ABC-type transport system substrate-binding protein